MKLAPAIAAIERNGILLVYPIANRPDPPSLWHALHPGREMRWAWDDDADPRVVELWHLRAALSRSRKVVYTKWLGGRATFFSRDVFRGLLARVRAIGPLEAGLSRDESALLSLLRDDSPRPTRALREEADLAGRAQEAAFTRAMRTLWSRLLIVGAGEVEEGGFPSLAVGASELLFEDLWLAAAERTAEGDALLSRALGRSSAFERAARRVEAALSRIAEIRSGPPSSPAGIPLDRLPLRSGRC
jgi:hypothetical protein